MGAFTITEPHPTVVQNTYTHSGRGGAGNYFRAPVTTPAAGVPSATQSVQSSGRFYSGRGGAGNAHVKAERPVLSFDELYRQQSHIEEKPQGHVGRGGAGNVYNHRKDSDASSHSASSISSGRSGFLGRLSQTLSRH